MSTCISKHGEYGAHTFTSVAYCDWCGAFDEAAAIREARAEDWHQGWRAGFEDRGRMGIVDARPTTNPYRD